MWPRWMEAGFGVWLLVSIVPFSHPMGLEARAVPLLAGVATLAISTLARSRSLVRLLGLVVALALIGWGWARFPRPGPPVAQNAIVVGLVLGLLAIVPSDSSEPPSGWEPYVKDG